MQSILKTENIKQYRKEYYQNNKDKWLKEKKCNLCGVTYNASTKWKHYKTKKHKIAEMEYQIEILKKENFILAKN